MRLVVVLFLLLVTSAAHAAPAASSSGTSATAEPPLALADDDSLYRCKKYGDSARIRVTFKPEVALDDLLAWAMGFSCKSFVLGTGVAARSQKVTIMAPAELTPKEAYRLFLTGLSTMGLTVVPRGKVLEVVELGRAKEAALPLTDSPRPDAQTTRVLVRPKFLALADASAVLGSLKSATGVLVEVPAANAILVTDSGENVTRMLEVLAQVDVQRRTRLLRLALEHADAEDVLPTLKLALGKEGGVEVVADARTNALLVVAPEARWPEIRELVATLDVPQGGSGPRAHVVRLQYASAEETAQVLAGVLAGGAVTGGKAPAAAASTSDVKVSFAKSTNALIVVADEDDFRTVRGIVRDLDVQRPQVYVEAVVLETSLNRSREMGVSFHGVGSKDDLSGLVASSQNGTSLISKDNAQSLMSGLAVGLFGPDFDILGLTIPSLGAVFQLAHSNTDVNVLSMPQIIATDHEKSTLKVGRNVAIKTTTSQVVNGVAVTLPNTTRQPLNLSLAIEPTIGATGDVTLRIDLGIEELDASLVNGEASWTTRELSTVVSVRDGQPIVLGGLISDVERKTRTKVPVLGDIPLVGVLFRSTRNEKEKRSLMIILVPTVLPDARSARALYARKMQERQEFARAMDTLAHGSADGVDFTSKRGLVAEIDVQVRKIDEETDLRVAPPAAP